MKTYGGGGLGGGGGGYHLETVPDLDAQKRGKVGARSDAQERRPVILQRENQTHTVIWRKNGSVTHMGGRRHGKWAEAEITP